MFDSFYRSGSLVFGGGHIVLPLLEREFVPTGWMDQSSFLAGYGATQAVPGPLFTFATIYWCYYQWMARGIHCNDRYFLTSIPSYIRGITFSVSVMVEEDKLFVKAWTRQRWRKML